MLERYLLESPASEELIKDFRETLKCEQFDPTEFSDDEIIACLFKYLKDLAEPLAEGMTQFVRKNMSLESANGDEEAKYYHSSDLMSQIESSYKSLGIEWLKNRIKFKAA